MALMSHCQPSFDPAEFIFCMFAAYMGRVKHKMLYVAGVYLREVTCVMFVFMTSSTAV